jgi:peptidoglycan/xylan/chitin deacetylase (PgdA/CDA1 family)
MRIPSRLRSVIDRVWRPTPKPLILSYHRIADDSIDHWCLAVSPRHFDEQIDVLRRTRQPLPLVDFVRAFIAGTLPANAVALTFDDGYVDNLVAAKPRLAIADVPATVFLATGYLGRDSEFWWDELANILLVGDGPESFDLRVGGQTIHLDLGGAQRRKALLTIWQAMRGLQPEECELVMTGLRSLFVRRDDHASRGRPMTFDEVRTLATDGLVTIGAHTVTHPPLSMLETAACHREVADSKRTCEALIGAPVVSFAYPFGDFNGQAREAVKSAGFIVACSTRRGPVVATSDTLAMPRVHILNWSGDEFERVLRVVSAAG